MDRQAHTDTVAENARQTFCTSQMDRQAHTDTGKNGQYLKMPDKYTVLHKWTGRHILTQVGMDNS